MKIYAFIIKIYDLSDICNLSSICNKSKICDLSDICDLWKIWENLRNLRFGFNLPLTYLSLYLSFQLICAITIPVPAKANMALYQPVYTASQLDEAALEQKITKGIQEGILAAFAQQQRMDRP